MTGNMVSSKSEPGTADKKFISAAASLIALTISIRAMTASSKSCVRVDSMRVGGAFNVSPTYRFPIFCGECRFEQRRSYIADAPSEFGAHMRAIHSLFAPRHVLLDAGQL